MKEKCYAGVPNYFVGRTVGNVASSKRKGLSKKKIIFQFGEIFIQTGHVVLEISVNDLLHL